ncbi:hypothetical protein HDU96_005060 [Phlyctochytrium bullatum]|nr:hypothetical protein HDU96_005060 [Phlyctochytrium bullatum]
MESLSRDVALTLLPYLHPAAVAELLVASRRTRSLFMLFPDNVGTKLATRQLSRHVKSSLVSSAVVPFKRLPMAYALAWIAWQKLSDSTFLDIFPMGRMLKTSAIQWDEPFQHPGLVEKFMRKALELSLITFKETPVESGLLTTQKVQNAAVKLISPLAFYIAGKLDSVELVKELVAKATPLFGKAQSEKKAMVCACFTGASNVVKYLLSITPDWTTQMKRSLIYIVTERDQVHLMDILFPDFEEIASELDQMAVTGLQWAATHNQTKACLWLLAHGADASIFTPRATIPPLHSAVKNGNLTLAEAILTQGVPIHPKEFRIDYPTLHVAVLDGRLDLVRLLLAHDAPLTDLDINDLTALHNAVAVDNMDIYNALVAAGADTGARTPNGIGLVHVAVAMGRLGMLKILHRAPAPNALPDTLPGGTTLLMYAAFYRHLGVVKWMMKEGGWNKHVDLKDDEGYTALDYYFKGLGKGDPEGGPEILEVFEAGFPDSLTMPKRTRAQDWEVRKLLTLASRSA